MGHGPAHQNIVKWRHLVVHRQNGFAFGVAHQHLEPGICFELGQVFGRGKAHKGVDVFGHHGGKGGRWVRDEFKRGRVQRGGGAPVVGVLDQFNPITLHPVGKFERACANRQGGQVIGGFRCHDHRIAPGHVEQEITGGRG